MQHFRKMCYNFLCVSASTISHKKPMDHIHTKTLNNRLNLYGTTFEAMYLVVSVGKCYMQR